VSGSEGTDQSARKKRGAFFSLPVDEKRARLASAYLAENLQGLGGRISMGFGPGRVLSVPDARGKILQEQYVEAKRPDRKGEICPDCGNAGLQYTEGCLKCPICGFAEC
jgi:hypothetical protein